MKLQLDENTLNAYINEAIRQELLENETDELFGSRVRKQSRRMITGQGWGNQKRSQNGMMAANSDISDTDANEEVPQTLVGMIKQMDQGLATIEQAAGMNGQYEGLADNVGAYRSGGGFKMKQSLLNAINALSRLADRLNAVERTSGSNAIMESAGDYMDATVGGNAALGNARNMAKLGGLQKQGREASRELNNATRKVTRATKKGGEASQELKTAQDAARAKSLKATKDLKAAGISRNTGFWGKQWANVKNGAKDVKTGFNTIKGARTYGKEVAGKAAKLGNTLGKDAASAARIGRAAKARQVANGLKIGFGGIGKVSQIPMLLLSIADEAARQGAEARQRKIVRTYNCASVLAKRMANIAQEIADAHGGQLQEINVRKSRSYFESIEAGMNQLSGIMKQINGQLNSQQNAQASTRMPASLNTPEEIRQFQEWANAHQYKDERGQELVPDGKFGPHTEYVYDQIAQRLNGTLQESKGLIREGSAVMNALTDLENKVGMTGAGGRAYSDISRMSGAYDGSRSQGARATKFIIRTYPPVLNQYLNVLADAGANVQGIQPLKVDNRPHRDYDVTEIQEIDTRIKQLLTIAQSIDGVQPREGNVKLPPKPVRQPRPTPNPNPNPTPKAPEIPEYDTDIQIEDEPIEIQDTDIQMKDDANLSVPTFGYANPRSDDTSLRERTYVDSIIDYMKGVLGGDTNSLKAKRQDMSNAYNKAMQTVNKNLMDGYYTPEQAKELKQKLNYYYKQFKRAARGVDITPRYTVSEQTFKKLVKQTLKEMINK